MAAKILSIDQGTTSSRAIVFNETDKILHTAQKELSLYYPNNGWVEQNPDDIIRDVIACVDECIHHHPDITAIGITNQRETTILWDRQTGRLLYNAIVWQDRRTAGTCTQLKRHENMIRTKTGLLLDPYFSATKIKWILDNIEGARAKAEAGQLAFGTIDSFILWHLTGGKTHSTDVTNACRTMLFNIHTFQWDDELLALFDIPRSILPEVKDNVANFGLYKNIPITGMAGDQQAALIGQACFEKGMIKSTYGTGCFALMNMGDVPVLSRHQLLTSIGYRINGRVAYVLEGSIFVAGAAVQWLRDGMEFFDTASESEALAQSVDDTGGVYCVPAFTGLGAPYWKPSARGAIFGITRATTKAHIARAVLEAQAYQTLDLMEAMVTDSGITPSTLRVDGGLVRNHFMAQFLSDMVGVTVDVPQSIETTAMGAAYLAGLGAGIYQGLDDITRLWQRQKTYTPTISKDKRDALYQGWKECVSRLV